MYSFTSVNAWIFLEVQTLITKLTFYPDNQYQSSHNLQGTVVRSIEYGLLGGIVPGRVTPRTKCQNAFSKTVPSKMSVGIIRCRNCSKGGVPATVSFKTKYDHGSRGIIPNRISSGKGMVDT